MRKIRFWRKKKETQMPKMDKPLRSTLLPVAPPSASHSVSSLITPPPIHPDQNSPNSQALQRSITSTAANNVMKAFGLKSPGSGSRKSPGSGSG
ncbi:hypothetical protein VIGAN_09039800 [Vigna angularis var. angularis]|uniref:Uncharacterized protein n=1 Tax=Vigna angularis var. angularis TaxID=157739 RepID=A0A0S3SWR9_PHAAN|nr:hypothetical protein VIGAN_09039800 [Vigna angularis var. angularis]